MSDDVDLLVGAKKWTVRIPTGKRTALSREDSPVPLVESPGQYLSKALNSVGEMKAPLRRGFTPDDRIAIVIDELLPHLPELIVALLEHLASVPLPPANVTLLVPPGGTQAWLDELPDEFGDVNVEVHNPTDSKKNAYLATTKEGRRVYLNRTLVEADAAIVLSGRRYVPIFGYGGAEVSIYPALCGSQQKEPKPTGKPQHSQHDEALEVFRLLGSAFLVQIIEGPGDTIAAMHVGLAGSSEWGAWLQDKYWKCKVETRSDLVIATISGNQSRIRVEDFVLALTSARRALAENGRIVLLSDAAPEIDDRFHTLRRSDNAIEAYRQLDKDDQNVLAARWAKTAAKTHMYICSGWPDELAEELFATPLHTQSELQRLIDAVETVLVIPDANKCRFGKVQEVVKEE